MDSQKPHSRAGLKTKLLNALKLGTGSLVLATSVTVAAPTDAATRPPVASVLQRADAVRSQLTTGKPVTPEAETPPTQLAWWGNWHNFGYHPYWHNWPNWRNWHNWGNW